MNRQTIPPMALSVVVVVAAPATLGRPVWAAALGAALALAYWGLEALSWRRGAEAEIKAAIAVAIGGMVLRFALVLGVLLLVGLFARGALATAAISFLAAFTLYVGLRLFMYPMTPPRRPGQARSR